MIILPLIPKDRNWSPETWRAGLDEAARRGDVILYPKSKPRTWAGFEKTEPKDAQYATIAHATTLLDASIVKPVPNSNDLIQMLQEGFHALDDAAIGECIEELRAVLAREFIPLLIAQGITNRVTSVAFRMADDFIKEAQNVS